MRRLFIANRGEIAVRIIRSAHSMGIETVLGFSEGDRQSLPVRLADQAICIGGARSADSYLNAAAVVTAAVSTACDAVHPGYGFLSESAEFGQLCEDNGLIFVGPQPSVIAAMGNKSMARAAADSAGVPVLPGTGPLVEPPDSVQADEVGYPLLLKAVAGGGGRGIRLVNGPAGLESAFEIGTREAAGAFGDGRLYMERYLDRVRHIEVQVMGDGKGEVVHLGERECSVQRRHQKVVEESPGNIPDLVRQRICEHAVALARQIHYRGAGTVEFLYEEETTNAWFIEMNARLQVEHPVTELCSGLDLVRAQLRVASGGQLGFDQADVALHGHAIEFRITCESLARGLMPQAGTIALWTAPEMPHVRVDTHCFSGYSVPPYYDSLLAKLIVWGSDRRDALERLGRAASRFTVDGIDTSLDLLEVLLENEEFKAADFHTNWLAPVLDDLLEPTRP